MSRPAPTLAELAAQRRQQAERRRKQPGLASAGPRARWQLPDDTPNDSEGWLLTYLDVVTLLLALLVVLLGMSQFGWPRANNDAPQLVGSIAQQGLPAYDGAYIHQDNIHIPAEWATLLLPGEQPPAHPADVGPLPRPTTNTAQGPVVPKLKAPSAQDLQELGLTDLDKNVDVIINDQSVSFRISNELLFPSGQATLSPRGQEIVRRLAKVINRSVHPVSVEGHSDNVPIRTRQFPSNWELSTSRATSVLRALIQQGVAANRLHAAGYAQTRPIASNDTAEGRARNRRVELIMQIAADAQAS